MELAPRPGEAQIGGRAINWNSVLALVDCKMQPGGALVITPKKRFKA